MAYAHLHHRTAARLFSCNEEGDAAIKMYYADAKHNFLTGNPEGMLAEIPNRQTSGWPGCFPGWNLQKKKAAKNNGWLVPW